MKTRNSNQENETVQQGGGFCGTAPTPIVEAQSKESSCCEQPTDGTSCCDKEESKETNIALTGCC